jgi:hypothetical protein
MDYVPDLFIILSYITDYNPNTFYNVSNATSTFYNLQRNDPKRLQLLVRTFEQLLHKTVTRWRQKEKKLTDAQLIEIACALMLLGYPVFFKVSSQDVKSVLRYFQKEKIPLTNIPHMSKWITIMRMANANNVHSNSSQPVKSTPSVKSSEYPVRSGKTVKSSEQSLSTYPVKQATIQPRKYNPVAEKEKSDSSSTEESDGESEKIKQHIARMRNHQVPPPSRQERSRQQEKHSRPRPPSIQVSQKHKRQTREDSGDDDEDLKEKESIEKELRRLNEETERLKRQIALKSSSSRKKREQEQENSETESEHEKEVEPEQEQEHEEREQPENSPQPVQKVRQRKRQTEEEKEQIREFKESQISKLKDILKQKVDEQLHPVLNVPNVQDNVQDKSDILVKSKEKDIEKSAENLTVKQSKQPKYEERHCERHQTYNCPWFCKNPPINNK